MKLLNILPYGNLNDLAFIALGKFKELIDAPYYLNENKLVLFYCI